jgi:hypothetical protein
VKPSIVPQPGDIFAVRSPGTAGRLIRFGAALRELVTGSAEPNLDNHIAVVHHTDKAGTLWVLEGRPGGVGWRDAGDYLKSPWTVTNVGQPKTDAQRKQICGITEAMIGTAYDWAAIAEDGALAFGLKDIWTEKASGQVPAHIVCSSLAAYAYDKAGVPAPAGPGDYRHVSPADWTAFILSGRWES